MHSLRGQNLQDAALTMHKGSSEKGKQNGNSPLNGDTTGKGYTEVDFSTWQWHADTDCLPGSIAALHT